MAKTKGNKPVLNTDKEKVVTKYDQKVQKRKEEAAKEAKAKKITIAVVSAVVAVFVIIIGIAAWNTYDRVNNEYISVDNDKVNQKEFDFYYSLTKNNILSQQLMENVTYADYFKSYMGYNVNLSDKSQAYGTNTSYTWYDYFASSTVDVIKEYKAVLKIADEKGFNYDKLEEDYKEFQDDLAKEAEEAEVSVGKYYKLVFGDYATEKSIKPYVDEYLKAVAYQEALEEEYKPSEDELKKYYEENKDDWDQVDYRMIEITAEKKDDEAALKAAKELAEKIQSSVKSEDDFKKQYEEHATGEEEDKENKDPSLVEGAYKGSVVEEVGEWLFDSKRKEGDMTIVEDEDNDTYTVVYFIKKYYDDDNDESMEYTIIGNKYSELVNPYIKDMKVDNKSNRIKMLGK